MVSDNLNWEQFSRVNNYLYELTGVKSVLSISRIYPYNEDFTHVLGCLLYTSPSPRDATLSRMPSSA